MTESESESSRTGRTRQYSDLLRAKHRELGVATSRDLDVIALVTGLSRLEARLVQDFERTAHRPLGLTWAGFRILNALWVYGELPQREIGRVAGSSRASISSALTTLETRELVVRQRTADDRRQFIVTLTPLGLDTLHKAIIKQTERERAWTAALDGGELVQLLGLLQRLVDQETPPAQ